jgi:hypothetical protein
MTGSSTPTQVPGADHDHDPSVQRAPDGTPYAVQPGDVVAPSASGPGGDSWRERSIITGFWFALGFLPLMWGMLGLVQLFDGVITGYLGWTFVSAFGLTMAFRSAIKTRKLFGPPKSSYLERSMLGIFRKRW